MAACARIECGALGVSGGWNPNVHLTCHQRGRPAWNANLPPLFRAARCRRACLSRVLRTGISPPMALGIGCKRRGRRVWDQSADVPPGRGRPRQADPFWYVEGCQARVAGPAKRCDRQGREAGASGRVRSVEHLKRYTTLGMATDQGKTSNMGGLAIMAELAGKAIPEVGTTIFRPPLHAYSHRRARGSDAWQGFPPDPPDPLAFLGQRTRRGVCRGRQLAARAVVPHAGRNPLAASVDREVRRHAPLSACVIVPRWARSTCKARMRRRS